MLIPLDTSSSSDELLLFTFLKSSSFNSCTNLLYIFKTSLEERFDKSLERTGEQKSEVYSNWKASG